MTEGMKLKKELESKEKIADADREQRERASKRKFATDLIGSVTNPFKGTLDKVGNKIGKFALSKFNDVKWYKAWTPDIDRYANLPAFNNAKMPYDNITSMYELDTAGTLIHKQSIPGVMAIEWIPQIGNVFITNTGSSVIYHPINVSLSRDLSQLRKSNSRAMSYNPDVLGFYFLSVIEVASCLANLKRILELSLKYSIDNSYLPDSLIRACGANPNVIKLYRAEFIKVYNQYATRFNSNLVIPKDYSLLHRRVWLNSTVFKDMNLRRGQHYVFKQLAYGYFRSDETGIDFSAVANIFSSTTALVGYFDQAFTNLEESVTMMSLVADLRSAIPSSNFAKIETDVTNDVPIFDATHEVLGQIHNLMTLPEHSTSVLDLASVESDGTYLIPKISAVKQTYTNAQVAQNTRDTIISINNGVAFDSYSENLTTDEVLVSTRLKMHLTPTIVGTAPTEVIYNISDCGTEIVNALSIYYWDEVTGNDAQVIMHTYETSVYNYDKMMACFDWAPLIYRYSVSDTNLFRSHFLVGEVGNVIYMSTEYLANLHQLCICSEVYLPDSIFVYSQGVR